MKRFWKDADKKTVYRIDGKELVTAVEYRIVCDADEFHVKSGETYHYDSTACVVGLGRPTFSNTFSEAEAIEELEEVREKCAKYDAFSRENARPFPGSAVVRSQSNIRIQKRYVTEWFE